VNSCASKALIVLYYVTQGQTPCDKQYSDSFLSGKYRYQWKPGLDYLSFYLLN
jgi:hypothetical protein